MELRQLQYFVTVVDERSVSQAAVRLHMTQPPLSTSMRQLEKEIGVPLLRRHARGVEPTDAGLFLAEEARRLLRHLDDVQVRARAVGAGRLGRLGIATVTAGSWHLLPSILRAFHRRAPDVDLDVEDVLPDEVVERVRDRRAGVGLVYCADTQTLARSAAAGLETAVARREPLVAVVPRDHPAASASVIDLRDLADEPWIVPSARASFAGLPEILRRAWQEAGVAPRHQRSSATPTTALALVVGGQGVTVLPSSVNAVAGPEVRVAPLQQPVPPLEAAVVWPAGAPSPVLSAFLAAALATPEPDQLGQGLVRRRAGLDDEPGPDVPPWRTG
ncbi:LysR family transcriptional regulator [Georgenia sp. EYE_87]|uniref:LysR family transcriptional regulator n=1 Tax=Georgenia sp. EYE_87 TaxID=2853448 RepID=UPI00200694AD|nr:LysR substrate-binding domain-containing protein [Georgenia sp. EYE_87]MCK6211615.1 LysR family transcriptional regulator [Georgenia sp. EYE_87]